MSCVPLINFKRFDRQIHVELNVHDKIFFFDLFVMLWYRNKNDFFCKPNFIVMLQNRFFICAYYFDRINLCDEINFLQISRIFQEVLDWTIGL